VGLVVGLERRAGRLRRHALPGEKQTACIGGLNRGYQNPPGSQSEGLVSTERAQALIALARPEFRDRLIASAKAMHPIRGGRHDTHCC
jgi:hypothetical protein